MQTRPIKAFCEQQVADLQAGRGMGLALAAELNGYPGPAHIFVRADKLNLSADQRASVQQLFNSMKQEALPLGAFAVSDCAKSSHAPDGKAPPASFVPCPAHVVAVRLVDLRLQHRPHVTRLDTDHW